MTMNRRRFLTTTTAIGTAGLAGCLGESGSESADTSNGTDNQSQNGSGADGNESNESSDPSEKTLEEQMDQATGRMVYLDDLPEDLEATGQQILDSLNPLGSENVLYSANREVVNRYREIEEGTKIVEEGGTILPREWELPNGDIAYTFDVGARPHPEGPYSDMSEIIDGDSITDEDAHDHLSTVISYMMSATTRLLDDHVPSAVADDEPPVAGCNHIVHDQENGALAWTGLGYEDFEYYVSEADRLSGQNDTFAENFLRQLEDYAHEHMEFDEHEVYDGENGQNALLMQPEEIYERYKPQGELR